MMLFPQLPRAVAEHLTEERRRLSIRDAAAVAAVEHPDSYFTPTGGSRATDQDLTNIRRSLVAAAEDCGYPTEGEELDFDKRAAALLHSAMKLSPSEASRPGVRPSGVDPELAEARAEIARLSEALKEMGVRLMLAEGKGRWD